MNTTNIEFKKLRDKLLSKEMNNVFELREYLKFEDYLKNTLVNDEVVIDHIEAALEEYFKDRNKNLFLSVVEDIIYNYKDKV